MPPCTKTTLLRSRREVGTGGCVSAVMRKAPPKKSVLERCKVQPGLQALRVVHGAAVELCCALSQPLKV